MICIKGSFISLNEYINAERSNRFYAAKLKKEGMEEIMWQLKGTSKIEGKINVTIQAYVKNKKKDPDNIYLIFCKFLLDSLVELGIIENDGQKNIGQITFKEVLIGEERMEVTIEKGDLHF